MTTEAKTAPGPGIYPDVEETEYWAWPAANYSALKILDQQTPKHCRYTLDNPSEPTDEMKFGSALHCKVLRPEAFDKEWTVAPTCQVANKSTGAACRNDAKYCRDGVWACGVHGKGWPLPEGDTITEDKLMKLMAMEASIKGHRTCRKLLEEMTGAKTECAITWIDPVTGVPCKAKLDLWGYRDVITIADLKSCNDASEDGFSRQIAEMRYHMQAAMYLDGLSITLGGEEVQNFQFLAIEKEPPFACAAYHLHQEDIALGREQYRNALTQWKFCHEVNAWPGYKGGPLHLPRYYFDRESKRK